ncbi:tetratricopeptide repeat protein [Anaerolineales bacterium HSG25]|nr:tetratricopeptide repeat protein [Anaerolineales bacterium HSG25]
MTEQQINEIITQLNSFITTETLVAKKTCLIQNPALLTDEALQMLHDNIERTKQQQDEQGYRVFVQHYNLLIDCQQKGIESAFADKIQPQTSDLIARLQAIQSQEELKQLLLEHPELHVQQMTKQTASFENNSQFQFLMQVLQIVEQNPTPQALYPLLQDNLHQLNLNLAQIIQQWASTTFRQQPNHALNIARDIGEFCGLIKNFPLGSRADNIEIAIAGYKVIGIIFTHRGHPEIWGVNQNNLGFAYADRIRGKRADNLEQAIEHHNLALMVRTKEFFPEKWAMTQNNLGIAYQKRIRGKRADNLEQAIEHYNSTLTIYTQETFPEKWAMTQNDLAVAYQNRIRGERAENLEKTIDHCNLALTIHTIKETSPEDWAGMQNNLAIAYRNRIRGEQADNIEQAIKHYNLALTIYTQEAFPEYWARTQNNLAIAYQNRIRGKRADNLEQAIEYFRLSLTIYTQEAFSEYWAKTQNNLGIAYQKRIRGERADNLEQAIEYYNLALTVRIKEILPEEWANTQNNLGLAYTARIRGERADNLEQAIEYYNLALMIRTKDDFPEKWAMIQNNMGEAYRIRVRGKRADNLEKAIKYFQSTLDIRTKEAFPEKWAETQDNLANAYSNRIRGKRADNLEKAIKYFQSALNIRTKEAFPGQWAETQNNLAIAYLYRIRGKRADNLEQAIEYLNLALSIHTKKAFPEEWAGRQNNLALVYTDRIQGERADNLEKAIKHNTLAFAIYTKKAFPENWAGIQVGLGSVYADRIRGERADNLEQAIKHYNLALTIFTKETFPEKWISTQARLGNIYANRIRSERADNLEKAIKYYNLALTIYTQTDFPEGWADTQHNLANVYSNRIHGKRQDNLEQAIKHFNLALTIRTKDAFPGSWAMVQHNLATTYADRVLGERVENLEQAIEHFYQALTIYTQADFPQQWAETQNNLANTYLNMGKIGRTVEHYRQSLTILKPTSFPHKCRDVATVLSQLLYQLKRYPEALDALDTAHQAVEQIRRQTQRDEAKRKLSEDNAGLYSMLVHTCLLLEDRGERIEDGGERIEDGGIDYHTRAFNYALAGKGRAFVDMLASTQFDVRGAAQDDAVLAEDLQKAHELRQQIDNILAMLTGTDGMRDIGDQDPKGFQNLSGLVARREGLSDNLRTLQQQDSQLWSDLAYKHPQLTATQTVPAIKAPQAMELAQQLGATLVEYFRHAGGWSAFVVTGSAVRHVALPDLSDALLAKMSEWVEQIGQRMGLHDVLYDLYDAVIRPLGLGQSKLCTPDEQERLILAPFGALHLLPLILTRHEESDLFLDEQYQVSLMPSITAIYTALAQAERDAETQTSPRLEQSQRLLQSPLRPQRLLSVAYPAEGAHYLPNVLAEAKAVAQNFTDVVDLHKDEATVPAVLQQTKDRQVIHFGCHGLFRMNQPDQSGLLLADGWLTVQQIITQLPLKGSQLVTLGACQTGQTGIKGGEEHVGLMQAVMTAGTPTVVASLWSVDDQATRWLFEAFYARLAAGQTVQQAMYQARQAIRKQQSHPYYWAAFQVYGTD